MEPHSYVITDNLKELIIQSSPHPSTSNDKEIHGKNRYDSPKNQHPQAKENE